MQRRWLILACASMLHACGGGGSKGSSSAPPPTNQTPQASGLTGAANPGMTATGTLSATDADGDALTYSLVSGPSSGSVSLLGTNNQNYEYVPIAGFSGADSFTYNASDGQATSNTATVTITINNQPVAVGAAFSTSDIASITDSVSSTDAEGDAVTYAVATEPNKGTLTLEATGAFTYEPDSTENGVDTFAFVANDPYQSSPEATVTIEIFGWAQSMQFGGIADDLANTGGIVLDDDGSLLLGGLTRDSIDGTVSAGNSDSWLRKVDRRGNEVWTVQFGDEFDDGVRNLWPNPIGDGFYAVDNQGINVVHEFDDSGNEIRNFQLDYGTADVTIGAYWNTMDSSGFIYVLSWTRPVGGIIDSLISKIDTSDGSVVWQIDLSSSTTDPVNPFISDSSMIFARGVDLTSTEDIVVTGSFQGGSRDCVRCPFLASFDTDGNELWLREPDTFSGCGQSGDGQFFRSVVDSDDSLYVAGITEASFTAFSDAVLSRFSADGTTELWSHCHVSGDKNTQAFVPPLLTADGNVLLYAHEEAEVDPVTSLRESAELLLYKFDKDGNVLWLQTINTTQSDGTAAYTTAGSIVEDSQGVIYLSGQTDGEMTSAANAGASDVFLIRRRPDGSAE